MTLSSTAPLDKSSKNALTSEEDVAMEPSRSSHAELLRPLLVAFAWAFDAQQAFISVFTDAEPTWSCLKSTDAICHVASNPCGLPSDSWAWISPSHSSSISEWGLVCSGKILSSFPASSFFVGSLVGGLLLSTLADSALGRKKLLIISCLIMSLSGALASLSPNFWVYCILRFVSGFGRSAIGTCSLVLCSEMATKRWRDAISVSGFFFFTLGFSSLPALAFAGRRSSWRLLYLWTCVPALCYTILVHFIVPESPRWLSMKDHTNKFNMAQLISKSFSSMKKLVVNRSTLLKLINIMMVGSGIGMVFYGMPLSVGNLSSNLYLSVFYNALADLPAAITTYIILVNIKRRISLVALAMFCGIGSLICVFRGINPKVQLAAEVISFWCASMALNVALIYGVELFPTCIRNSALSLVRQAVLLGGALAPVLLAVGRRTTRLWSFGVFGIVVFCCGLSAIFLPETKGKDLTENMEEENQIESSISTP